MELALLMMPPALTVRMELPPRVKPAAVVLNVTPPEVKAATSCGKVRTTPSKFKKSPLAGAWLGFQLLAVLRWLSAPPPSQVRVAAAACSRTDIPARQRPMTHQDHTHRTEWNPSDLEAASQRPIFVCVKIMIAVKPRCVLVDASNWQRLRPVLGH